jgi:hypothetical protein
MESAVCRARGHKIFTIQLDHLNYVTQRLGMETTYSERGTGTFYELYTDTNSAPTSGSETNQFNSYRYGSKHTRKRKVEGNTVSISVFNINSVPDP